MLCFGCNGVIWVKEIEGFKVKISKVSSLNNTKEGIQNLPYKIYRVFKKSHQSLLFTRLIILKSVLGGTPKTIHTEIKSNRSIKI